MGWAVSCEMCHCHNVAFQELDWNIDIATFVPRAKTVRRLVMRCNRCNHIKLTYKCPVRFDPKQLNVN